MTAHGLARIVDPAVYGYRVWLCCCGHRAPTPHAHRQHVEAAQ